MSLDDATSRRAFPPIEQLLPHRGNVVLLHRILRHDAESTDAGVSIAKQKWLKHEDGRVRVALVVEYMAQCVAAREGLLALAEGRPPPKGFLVGVTRLRLEVPEIEADAELLVRSRRVRGRPSLGALSHRCELFLDQTGSDRAGEEWPPGEPGPLIAEGRLSVSVPRDSPD